MAEENDASCAVDPEIRALLPKNLQPAKEKFWKKGRRWFWTAGKPVVKWAPILYMRNRIGNGIERAQPAEGTLGSERKRRRIRRGPLEALLRG